VYTNEPGPYGPLMSQRRGGQTNYYHFDGQGSTRQMTDASQNVTDSARYSAFGEVLGISGSTTNPFGYKGAIGYYVNAQSPELYVRARELATNSVMTMIGANSNCSRHTTAVSTTAADGLTGRVCPSVCPSDWDKRKTPFASPCLQATCEGRQKTKRRGQDANTCAKRGEIREFSGRRCRIRCS